MKESLNKNLFLFALLLLLLFVTSNVYSQICPCSLTGIKEDGKDYNGDLIYKVTVNGKTSQVFLERMSGYTEQKYVADNDAIKKGLEKYCRKYPVSSSSSSSTSTPTEYNVDITDNRPPLKMEMVFVQGGTFQMGSNEEDDEKPIHSVTVSGFYMGRYEVTQAQWRNVMGSNPSEFKDCDNCPVENVSWNDVQEYIQKLNQKTGKTYRLPTEAEWEFAAKGGVKSKGYIYAGSNTVSDVAEYEGNNNNRTRPVGLKASNELGLYDMSGNVWEWCSDRYSNSYYANSPTTNPQGASSDFYRVLRGGSWNSSYCRVAYRAYINPVSRRNYNGFRLVLVP